MTARTAKDSISVLLCDDHQMLADALGMALQADPQLRLVAKPVDNAQKAVEICAEQQPDVVLMDVQLNGPADGFEATRGIKRVSPSTKVVIVSGSGNREGLLLAAVEAGAEGFVDKTEAVENVIEVTKAAARGESLIDPQLLPRLLRAAARDREARRDAESRLGLLTEREREILQLFAGGQRSEDIAGRLHLSVRTVQTHTHNILTKLGVRSRLEAVALAAKAGAVKL